MLDPTDCGPATISMSQDVQGEVFEYPEVFYEEKIHEIRRIYPDPNQVKAAAETIKKSTHIVLPGQGAFETCIRGLVGIPGMIEELNNFVVVKKNHFLVFVLECNFLQIIVWRMEITRD